MTISSYFKGTVAILKIYRPFATEISGLSDLCMGITMFAHACIRRVSDSNDLGTGNPIATQIMRMSGIIIAQGLIKNSVTIIFLTGYIISKFYA